MQSNLVEKLKYRTQCTPDYVELSRTTNIPVFIADNIREDYGRHYLLKYESDVRKIGPCETLSNWFEPHMHEGNVYFTKTPNSFIGSKVKGELYLVPSQTLTKLDLHYNSKILNVTREEIWCSIKGQTRNIQAWFFHLKGITGIKFKNDGYFSSRKVHKVNIGNKTTIEFL